MTKYATVTVTCVMGPVGDPTGVAEQVTAEIADLWDDAKDIRVHVQLMPPEYNRMMSESDEAKRVIEADADQGMTFTKDVLGMTGTIRHPYEDGAWIFPEDHPLAGAERAAAQAHNTEVLNELLLAAPKLKELPRGDL